jgi:hypothetical protein
MSAQVTPVPAVLPRAAEQGRYPSALAPGLLAPNIGLSVLGATTPMFILATGVIAGDARWGFGPSAAQARWRL